MKAQFSHLDKNGKACMVDVSAKKISDREATATGEIIMNAQIIKLIKDKKVSKGDMLEVKAKKTFNDSHFSKREMKIFKNLAEKYKDKKAEEMIEITHAKDQPWYRVYVLEGKKYHRIPTVKSVEHR